MYIFEESPLFQNTNITKTNHERNGLVFSLLNWWRVYSHDIFFFPFPAGSVDLIRTNSCNRALYMRWTLLGTICHSSGNACQIWCSSYTVCHSNTICHFGVIYYFFASNTIISFSLSPPLRLCLPLPLLSFFNTHPAVGHCERRKLGFLCWESRSVKNFSFKASSRSEHSRTRFVHKFLPL